MGTSAAAARADRDCAALAFSVAVVFSRGVAGWWGAGVSRAEAGGDLVERGFKYNRHGEPVAK